MPCLYRQLKYRESTGTFVCVALPKSITIHQSQLLTLTEREMVEFGCNDSNKYTTCQKYMDKRQEDSPVPDLQKFITKYMKEKLDKPLRYMIVIMFVLFILTANMALATLGVEIAKEFWTMIIEIILAIFIGWIFAWKSI